MCSPALGAALHTPGDLAGRVLRSCRAGEWVDWFAAATTPCTVLRGAVCDSSQTMAQAAALGAGVALLPVRMFAHELHQGRWVRPFETEIGTGRYWLAWLKSRPVTAAMQAFSDWLVQSAPQ